MKNLTDFIKIYDNVLSKSICDNMISIFEEKPELRRKSSFTWDKDYRDFSELEITTDNRFVDHCNYVYSKINGAYHEYKTELSLTQFDNIGRFFPKNYGFEKLRMKKYEANDHDQFGWHVDVGDYASARRYLVMFLYLNDVDEGGETEFSSNVFGNSFQIKPKCGSMVVFPPMWMFPHIGKKPISGPKYILSSYAHYQ